jgi:hypothetical protein
MRKIESATMLRRGIPILILLTALLSGCGEAAPSPTATSSPSPSATAAPPPVTLVVNPDIKDVLARDTIALTVETSGQDLRFEWSVARGTLSSPDTPAVIYTAPDTPGVDTVTVQVSSASGTTTRNVSFNITLPDTATPTVAPPATPTQTPEPAPTATSTPTATSVGPVNCGPVTNPGCLRYISPQLAEFSSANSFLFTDERGSLQGEYSSAEFHSAPVSIKLSFNADEPGFGGWGIGNLPGYDASGFERVSFYVKGTATGQTFEFKLKDTQTREDTVLVTVDQLDWTKVTFDLNTDNFPTVDFSSLENVNLGFNDSFGSSTIYVDDLAFE